MGAEYNLNSFDSIKKIQCKLMMILKSNDL